MLYKPKWSKPSGSEIDPDAPELSQMEEIPPAQRAYLDTPVLVIFSQRFPWLLSLMLFQSVSGWVIEHFQGLIEKHVILAAFLTMLVGGGGNSSGQTVAELVKRLSTGELTPAHLPQVLAKEVAVGSLLAVGLAVGAYPRVRLLSSHATDLDAVAAQRVEKVPPWCRSWIPAAWGRAALGPGCSTHSQRAAPLLRPQWLHTVLPPVWAHIAGLSRLCTISAPVCLSICPRRLRCRTCSSSSWATRSGCSSR